MLFAIKLCFVLSLISTFMGFLTRFLGYGINRGAPWAFGITPDAFLRFTNTLLLYTIALGLMHWINTHPPLFQ